MDLQNHPRNSKSNRIQQPEALDSKTCYTFPMMACSSFVRMSDEQVLPLQKYNIFFVSKGLIERPAQHTVTAASEPGQRHWKRYCQTQSYLHFEHCIWMTSIETSRLWETRAGYRHCEMPIQIRAVESEAGAERDLRRRSVIKSQVHRQEHEHLEYIYNHFKHSISCIWCLYSCSAVGMHANSMQKISGSNLVCIFFEP
jgi:hypothetical protein